MIDSVVPSFQVLQPPTIMIWESAALRMLQRTHIRRICIVTVIFEELIIGISACNVQRILVRGFRKPEYVEVDPFSMVDVPILRGVSNTKPGHASSRHRKLVQSIPGGPCLNSSLDRSEDLFVVECKMDIILYL